MQTPGELRAKAYKELSLIIDKQERKEYLNSLEQQASAYWKEEAFQLWRLNHIWIYLLPVSWARWFYKKKEVKTL